jgi:hypothetical protein
MIAAGIKEYRSRRNQRNRLIARRLAAQQIADLLWAAGTVLVPRTVSYFTFCWERC